MRRQGMTPVVAAGGSILAYPAPAAVGGTVQAGGNLFVEGHTAEVQHAAHMPGGQQDPDASRQEVCVGVGEQLPSGAAIAAEVEAAAGVAVRRDVGFAGGAVD